MMPEAGPPGVDHGADTKAGEDQPAGPATADGIDADDPHKVEKLTKLGHEADPDEGSD